MSSSPAGISCGSDCSEAYLSGTVVSLTAIPASGSTFGGWSGDADCLDGIVTMSANKSCAAMFNGTSTGASRPNSKMVGALESAGLAQRERSETDRRVVLVSATPAGKRLLERGRAARVQAIAALLTDATEAQLQTLRAASEVIAARLMGGDP